MLHIISADYEGGYTLSCKFNNGETKKVDFTPLLKYPAFQELREKEKFLEFGVMNTVFWSTGADIAPEWIYANGKSVS